MSDQVANHAIAVGRGAGVSGLKSLAYGNIGEYLQSQGSTADPVFTALPSGTSSFLLASNRSVMSACDTTVVNSVFIYGETYRTGMFYKGLYSDYAVDVAADTQQGFVVRSTFDPTIVWVREVFNKEYRIDWFRDFGASIAADTSAVLAGLQAIPDGSSIYFSPVTYNLNPISATPRGSIKVIGYDTIINNASQVPGPSPAGLPLLRIFVKDFNHDVTIEGLTLQGPRLSSDTTVGTGAYGGDPFNPGPGFPSGIDIPIGRNVTLKQITVSGTYYIGIECHYVKNLIIENCNSFNHAYAGILWTDSTVIHACNNNVDDVGAVAPVEGYGISAGTSYNFPTYVYGNGTSYIYNNKVTRAKRKAIDVHNSVEAFIYSNYTKGAAYAHVECICEQAGKLVSKVIIKDNIHEGDPTFEGGMCTQGAISVGTFAISGAMAVADMTATISGNQVLNLNTNSGVSTLNADTAGSPNLLSCVISGNTFTGCVFTSAAIAMSNYSQLVRKMNIMGNDIDAQVGTAHIYVQFTLDALSTNNICRNTGTPPTTVTTLFNSVTNGNRLNNMLDGVLGG